MDLGYVNPLTVCELITCTCMYVYVYVTVPSFIPPQHLPCMNNLQTELKIFFEDASTGQYSSAYRLAVVPDMTVAEVCDIIAEKHCKANPENYGLFTVVDGEG